MRERDGLEVERSCFGPDFAEKLAACSKNMKVLLEVSLHLLRLLPQFWVSVHSEYKQNGGF
jgi:hypothetical protein